jgi:hypothetical protein
MTKRELWYMIWSMYRRAGCEVPSPLRTPAWAIDAIKRAQKLDKASGWHENRILRRQAYKRSSRAQPYHWNCRCVTRPITIHQMGEK